MFHFSTDRLAGLDNMILKITPPQKVPMLIPNRSLHDTTVKKLKKQKRQEIRPPLADKTASNNLVCNTTSHPPRLFISPFSLPARRVQRTPCSYTLLPPPKIHLFHMSIHQTCFLSVPSLPSLPLPPSSCRRSSISLPNPLTLRQIHLLTARLLLFLHLPSFASLPLPRIT